jgi:hypothetical protein
MFKNYISSRIVSFFSSLFYDNEKPDSIIEPLTCLIRLAILEFKPLHTKLSISNNRITYDEPTILQGAVRWSNGDRREDIHNIFNPIRKSGEWFDINNDDICTIFKFSIRGLEKLKLSYNENSTIAHSIEYYTLYLNNKINNKINNKEIVNKNEIENTENTEKNSIYLKLKQMWTKREINIINNILLELETSKEDIKRQESLITALESILTRKEEFVQNMLFETLTSLK